MKQFANGMSIKCRDIEERDKVAKILESVGWRGNYHYTTTRKNNKDYLVVSTLVRDSSYMFLQNISSHDNIHITDINEPLIRDLAAMCTNDTWHEGERFMREDRVMWGSPVMGLAGEKIGWNGSIRPTAKEICEYYGYTLKDDGQVVKKVPSLEEITHEPDTCFKTDDGCYIHDGESFLRVLPDYTIEKQTYKNGMRVLNDTHVLARFYFCSNANDWVAKHKPKPEPKFFVDYVGNNVYGGDTYFFVNIRTFAMVNKTIYHGKEDISGIDEDYARFKYKSDAEEYVRKNKPFEPFELSIPINTKEDLLHLWHRLNIPAIKVEKHDYGYNVGVESPTYGYDIYNMFASVDKKVVELGLKK